MTAPGAVRVMLCDDSPTARTAMARVLEADPQLRVVARAGDGRQALEMLGALAPEQLAERVAAQFNAMGGAA